MHSYVMKSLVEQKILEVTKKLLKYEPYEKIAVIEVSDFPMLGKLTALRFIEWLQLNPDGVVSLPTGKTPEFFIKWVVYFLTKWNDSSVQKELVEWGINVQKRPDFKNFYFVQIDEFYPMNPVQENSFAHYIERFYFKEFGFSKARALLIDTWRVGVSDKKTLGDLFALNMVDLSLRYRQPVNELEKRQQAAITAIDQAAMEYEEKIKSLGGIGFFLGGIGPDGHIGFNIRGSDHLSTTRLAPINYETAAAAAVDLGGIEIARKKVVVSIGLQTITQNQTTTAIIMAAGANKAPIVKCAVESNKSILYPASALQALTGARFYVTKGAACLLTARMYSEQPVDSSGIDLLRDKIVIDSACKHNKKLVELTDCDILWPPKTSFLKIDDSIVIQSQKIQEDIKKKITEGLHDFLGSTFLHTAPHHDDIMLGYLPYVVHLVRSQKNTHFFATMTSGFTSVSNEYTLERIKILEQLLEDDLFRKFIYGTHFLPSSGDWGSGKNSEIYHYLDGIAAGNLEVQKFAEASRLLRDFIELFNIEIKEEQDIQKIRTFIQLLKDYFSLAYPGKKDNEIVQKLKGMIREWEEELLWGHLGFNCNYVFHLRLGFYTGDIFTQQPEFERDIKPIIHLLESISPDIITVALDPEGSGPDTHYKVLQATAQALQFYIKKYPTKKIKVWGYRNVWFRFHPVDANIFVPVSMNSLAILKGAFHTCFGSQRSASFPSYEYDGPFCDLAQRIMVEQYIGLRTVLGEQFFYENSIPRLRATRGFCFLKSMELAEFFKEAAILREQMESRRQLLKD